MLKTDPALIDEAWPDEVVILNLTKGFYYSLRGSGICVWPYLKQGVSREQIFQIINHHFAEEESLSAWIDQMIAEEVLIETDEQSQPLVLPAPKEKKEPFVAPQFQVFKEMKDLLLLDPIHDTNEAGWPHQAVSSTK